MAEESGTSLSRLLLRQQGRASDILAFESSEERQATIGSPATGASFEEASQGAGESGMQFPLRYLALASGCN